MGRSIPEITQIGPRLVLGPNLVGSQCKLAVMSYLHPLRRPPRLNISHSLRRWYASTNKQVDTSTQKTEVLKSENEGAIEIIAKSSCPENTVLGGLAWLKNQSPILALPDDAYPSWLWTLLDRKELPDDGPGGKAEKYKLRKQNRQRIRDQNFMKTQ
ncbi:hypothetical protein AcV7_008599 [Taiwanofungus camphoratus]|nr:hypothetical protein AcV7_008599 [Antrodia cinnamomea]